LFEFRGSIRRVSASPLIVLELAECGNNEPGIGPHLGGWCPIYIPLRPGERSTGFLSLIRKETDKCSIMLRH
jgi:hypothetical protein